MIDWRKFIGWMGVFAFCGGFWFTLLVVCWYVSQMLDF